MSRNDPSESPFRYAAFGLRIESDLELTELEHDLDRSVGCDVRIVRSQVPCIIEGSATAAYRFDNNEVILCWRDVGDFRIIGIDRIEYMPRPGVDEALVNLPLLGPVMGAFLERRGVLTLHGSAVALSEGVAIFLGDKGAGKSTTAAVLLRAGKTLLTDDIVAIDCREAPLLHPAFSQLKLTQEASASIKLGAEEMPRPHPEFEKHILRISAPFSLIPRRPHAAFVLERGEAFALERLDGVNALKALMRFSYATRFGRELITGSSAAEHLRQCAALSRSLAVYRLIVPDDLSALCDLPSYLEAEIALIKAGAGE